jgi:hypothetical protein
VTGGYKQFKFHGWARKNIGVIEPPLEVSLFVGPVPGRKGLALYSTVSGSTVQHVHAWFKNEHEAELATKIIDFLQGGDLYESCLSPMDIAEGY